MSLPRKHFPASVGVSRGGHRRVSRCLCLANISSLWWGSVDQGQFPHPTEVGVCQFAVSSRSPYPRGGFSGSFSAIARASLLAPPLWGWVKRIPSAPQRGGFSCYRSCPPSWESVPTKISPFRWESVTLAQLPSPTSVGVSRLTTATAWRWLP